jgi:hypothetical protein
VTRTAVVALSLTLAVPSWAGFTFGQNKVRTTDFDWRVVETEHFRVYHDSAAFELATIAARIGEEHYRAMSALLDVEPEPHIPLIVYATPDLFAQTNVTPYLLPETVGGFYEFWKGRVVIPFDGWYDHFVHVVKHELVHVFTIEAIERFRREAGNKRVPRVPLWFIEGLAEYWSEGWSGETDLVLRDLVLNRRLLPPSSLDEVEGTFQMYKEGQAIVGWWSKEYGDTMLVRLLKALPGSRDFESAVEKTFGENYERLGSRWVRVMQKRYIPALAESDPPDEGAIRLDQSEPSLSPVLMRVGGVEQIVYLTGRRWYPEVRAIIAAGPKAGRSRTLLRAERSEAFESVHFGRSSVAADTNGSVALSTRRGLSDVIVFLDERGRENEYLRFDGLQRIVDPVLSLDGTEVAFVASGSDGFSDLYVYYRPADSLVRLTADEYGEGDPAFSPDGRSLAYMSDAVDSSDVGWRGLFVRDLVSGDESLIAAGRIRDPAYSSDGHWLAYSASESDGRVNIVAQDTLGTVVSLTNVTTAVVEPCFRLDDRRIVYTAYHDGTFGIFERDVGAVFDSVDASNSRENGSLVVPIVDGGWSPGLNADLGWEAERARTPEKEISEYGGEYSFDIASIALEYSAVLGVYGGFEAAVSDMLGNHVYHFYVANTAQVSSDVIESFNVVVTYINRTGRIAWGLGAFHLVDEYDDDETGLYREREVGMLGVLAHPFSRFRRIELTGVARVSNRYDILLNRERQGFLASLMLSLVHDNSLWEPSGPIDGVRANVTVAVTVSARNGMLAPLNRLAFVDLRHYLRLGERSAWANRFWSSFSVGSEPERFHLGGSWSLRGYNRRAFTGSKVFFYSSELRFPLVDRVVLDVPAAGRMRFPGLSGAMFVDAGRAFDGIFSGLVGSVGWGLRLPLGPFLVLRFDQAWPVREGKLAERPVSDVFFGWNF